MKGLSKAAAVLFSFYRRFLATAWIVTALLTLMFWHAGLQVIGTVILLKLVTDAAILILARNYNGNTDYYYFNLGWSARKLWACALSLDFLLFITLLILAACY